MSRTRATFGTVDAVVRWALAAWTAVIWGSRIRNILDDGGGTGALVVAVGLVALAVAVAVDARAVPLLAATTVAVWVVRVPLVLSHGHGAAFVVVHLVLAAVSVALAVVAWRRQRSLVSSPS